MSLRATLLAVLLVVLAECFPNRSLAQSPSTVEADSSLRVIVTRISADNPRSVRLSSRATGRVEGNSVSLIRDSVFLSTDSGMRVIAVADVDSVWVQRGSAAPILGIITAVPCAVFGALVGGFIGGDPDSNGSPRREMLLTLGGFVGGALVCGSVGAAIGSSIRRWPLEYPSTPEDAT
jgi:hypothetical protein